MLNLMQLSTQFLAQQFRNTSKNFSRFFFSPLHTVSRHRSAQFDCFPLNSYNSQQRSQQMNRKQSAHCTHTSTQKNKMKHAFTASLNGTTQRMPSHSPGSVAITIISIKWLSNNYIEKKNLLFFFFCFFVQRPFGARSSILDVCCRHLYAWHAIEWRAMCTHSKSQLTDPTVAAVWWL